MSQTIKIFLMTFAVFFFFTASHAVADKDVNEDLYSVLQYVVDSHPQLLAQRAARDKEREKVKEARSGWQPNIVAEGSARSQLTEPGSFGTKSGETANVGLSVTQPLYRGGQTVARTREAEKTLYAQEASLRALEQTVLLETVSAYIALVRDHQLVGLREKNVANLKEHLASEQTRFELGENTVTDLSQSKARLAAAEAGLAQSRGQFSNTVADYERVTGMLPPNGDTVTLPGAVLQEKMSFLSTMEVAIEEGIKNHPDIIQAEWQAAANKDTQRSIKGELYPSLSVIGQTQRTFRPIFASSEAYQDQSQVVVQAEVPLYAAGATRSRLKQSRHDGKRLRLELVDMHREVRQGVTSAWQNLQVARAEMVARQTQVKAAKLALDGTQEEHSLGGRTTLDVLDAEEEKLDADVAMVTARHDVVLAEFSLLAATGQLGLNRLQNLLP